MTLQLHFARRIPTAPVGYNCMCVLQLGVELLAIFEVTRDKEDTRRAEAYFNSAKRLDEDLAEEAAEKVKQALALRRSRRQRASAAAGARRQSIADGISRRRSSVMGDSTGDAAAAAHAAGKSRRRSVMGRRGSILGGRSSINGGAAAAAAAVNHPCFSALEHRRIACRAAGMLNGGLSGAFAGDGGVAGGDLPERPALRPLPVGPRR